MTLEILASSVILKDVRATDSYPVPIYESRERERRLDCIEARGVTWERAKEK